ncbi:MAG: DGQHR domain-containing protein, partial [Pyrinomonadaceae bacterium]
LRLNKVGSRTLKRNSMRQRIEEPMNAEQIQFNCIRVTQPIGTFYIGAIDARDLHEIAYADVRRIEDRDVEKYLGIQRELSPRRVKELQEYVKTVDATFPTSIIIAVSPENAEFDSAKNTMAISRSEKVAHIIDGQHRIAGLGDFDRGIFQLNVTVFVDMDLEDQAMVFATINLKQTKVSKSLAYDLLEFTAARSPQKTSHNIAKLLNSKDGSPFRNRIKILGLATGQAEESLTQATFVDRVMAYITKDPMQDRDLIKRGKQPPKLEGPPERVLVFRNMFLEDRDAEIARILWNYFKAVQTRWPVAWSQTFQGNILNRTTGFIALMKFLRTAYLNKAAPGSLVAMDEFLEIFNRIDLRDEDFNSQAYKTGSGGEAKLRNDLVARSGLILL